MLELSWVMDLMMRRLIFTGLACAGTAVASAAIFTENFSGFANGNVDGQGGWSSASGMSVRTDGMLPGSVLSGLLDVTSDGVRWASHGVSLVGESGTIVLGFDVFGLVANISDGEYSHNSGAGLGFDGTSIAAGWTAYEGLGYRFDATGLAGGGASEIKFGGMQDLAHLEVVIDRVAGEVFGRYEYVGGVTGETTHFSIVGNVDLLTSLTVKQDQNLTVAPQFYTGVDLDNFSLVANPTSVPEPFTLGLSVAGVGVVLRKLRRRRRCRGS